jgi:two-component system, chemotaxis family, CheB/CheR fusion protein
MEGQVPDSSDRRFRVVGVGASAGGLEALLELFKALETDTGMAFVVVQHLEPHSESQLAEILARQARIPLIRAQDGQKVEPDHGYVIPPNTLMVIENGTLHLAPRPESSKPYYPVDSFLESLAADKGADSVAVILSGSASDGAQGIRFIKASGGITFAQDERSAKYGGMPHSAIATGAVDFVLPAGRIAEELVRIDSHPYLRTETGIAESMIEPEGDGDFAAILERLRAATKLDFGQYKQSTIRRRLGRRLVINHSGSLREYLDYLDTHPGEIHEFYRDILISVTSFFREPKMFEVLAKSLQENFAGRDREEPFRIWVPGCATGEEAYSLAITCFEVLEKSGKQFPIQVFGTDISDSAIEKARSGIYDEKAIEDLSAARVQRFFSRVDSGLRIRQQVRDCCIFARHDLTSDPPFSQMDLVSCRNVFIYLSAGLQQRVLPVLHYSLKTAGLLILGTAETVGNRSDLFGIVDNENRIYSKQPGPTHLVDSLYVRERTKEPAPASASARSRVPTPTVIDLEARAARVLRDLYAPAGVLVDEDLQVLHFHGHTAFYMEQIPADGGVNLLRIARQELVFPIREGVSAALAGKQPVHQSGITVNHQGQTRQVNLSIVPLSDDARACLVLFEELSPPPAAGERKQRGNELNAIELELGYVEKELAQTKDYLRKIIEEHDAVTEELRAANEEVRSSNEELQSTNEELRTAKEQLQSSNEELTTLNDELQTRNRDLSLAINDLSNILTATTIPIVMVGMDLRLRRFTPAAGRLLGLVPTDIGRPITEINSTVQLPDLGKWLEDTIHTLAAKQRRVQDREGRWFQLSTRPYRTMDEHIEGAVLAFIDIDEATRALQSVEQARRFADGVIETVQHPLLILDTELRVKRATRAFFDTFGVFPNETIGREIKDLGNGQWNIPELNEMLQQALVRDVPFRDFEVTHDFPSLGRRVMRLNARRIPATDSGATVLLAIEDVTERQESAEIQYRRLFESAKDGIILLGLPAGTVLDVNPYFLEMSRYSLTELVKKKFWEIEPFVREEEMRELVPKTMSHGAARYDSVRLYGKDGRECIVEIIANSYRVKEQSFIQVNVRDVTARKRDEERLRRVNLDLQQFVFASSHDLQEPLRTITNYLELLKRKHQDDLGEETEQYITFVLSAADRMRGLLRDLLGYAHLLRTDVRTGPVSMEAALSATMLNLQLAIQQSGAKITWDSLPTVYADEHQIVQLLQNLIGNAIKYRGPEPPDIHIAAREAGPEWVFSVRDNGQGFDMKYAEQVFTIFKRLHGVDHPGTGVGLAICQRIVERWGGRIWVESAPGKGSTFFFTAPRELKQS